MTYDAGAEKQRGLDREQELIRLFGWSPSTVRQNIDKDIDAYTQKGTSISIKSIGAGTFQRTGNLAFELEVYDELMGWEPAWYQFGQARKYVFDIEGRGVYVIDKAELVRYVDQYGWDRVTQLKASTREGQRALGHRHTDASIGLVALRTLTRLKIAKRLLVPES